MYIDGDSTRRRCAMTGDLPVPAEFVNVATHPQLVGAFEPVDDTFTSVPLVVRGEIPSEIDGEYLRNGPNPAFPPLGS